MKLLIVDDDPSYIRAMTSFLLGVKHDVHSILDPKEVMDVIKDPVNHYDAMLLDLKMPGMNGLDLLRKIRDIGNPLPVVLVSGVADLESAAEAVHWGISGLVIKPFIPAQLVRILTKVETEYGLPSHTAVGVPDEEWEKKEEAAQIWRSQMSQVMRAVLDCWKDYTRGNKTDFAERSGIWTVNVDGASLRTRTMDRYLQSDLIPDRPNVRKVLASAHYVLENCPPSSKRFVLETKTRLLEFTLDAMGMWSPSSTYYPQHNEED